MGNTRYTGTLVSVEWNKGTNELHGGNTGIRNPTGGAFYFRCGDESTASHYHPKGMGCHTDSMMTFFWRGLYEALEGREGVAFSWEINNARNPVNVQVDGVDGVVCPYDHESRTIISA